jgi:hypothetical protein
MLQGSGGIGEAQHYAENPHTPKLAGEHVQIWTQGPSEMVPGVATATPFNSQLLW